MIVAEREDLEFTAALERAPPLEVADAAPAPDDLSRDIQTLSGELISGDEYSPTISVREVRAGRAFDIANLSLPEFGGFSIPRMFSIIQRTGP